MCDVTLIFTVSKSHPTTPKTLSRVRALHRFLTPTCVVVACDRFFPEPPPLDHTWARCQKDGPSPQSSPDPPFKVPKRARKTLGHTLVQVFAHPHLPKNLSLVTLHPTHAAHPSASHNTHNPPPSPQHHPNLSPTSSPPSTFTISRPPSPPRPPRFSADVQLCALTLLTIFTATARPPHMTRFYPRAPQSIHFLSSTCLPHLLLPKTRKRGAERRRST